MVAEPKICSQWSATIKSFELFLNNLFIYLSKHFDCSEMNRGYQEWMQGNHQSITSIEINPESWGDCWGEIIGFRKYLGDEVDKTW